MKLMLGIENEFEGAAPMWFDLNEPQTLTSYIKDNLEKDHKYEFSIKEMSEIEVATLE